MSALIHALVLDGQGGISKELTNIDQVSAWQSTDGLLWLHLDYCFDEAKDYLNCIN